MPVLCGATGHNLYRQEGTDRLRCDAQVPQRLAALYLPTARNEDRRYSSATPAL